MNLDKFENKKNHLQSIVNQKKEIEQNLIQAKQNIAQGKSILKIEGY